MDSALRNRLHNLTLEARQLLTQETAQLLEGVYGLHGDGRFEPAEKLPAIQTLPEVAETRARLEHLLADEKTAGLSPREAVEKLTKEVAYTWLNRFAAFKMLEARRLIRQSVSRGQQSGGFMLWLTEPGHEEDYARYEEGSLPLDALGEGPRDATYRHFLLSLCERMAGQVRVLFDPDNLPSRLCPRPRALADLLALVNTDELAAAWSDDETIGWIYQYFNEEEKAEVFGRLNKGAKISASEIPAATQLFTPRWIVRALVENSLGRLWLQMHPGSRLRETLDYLVPDVDAPTVAVKPVHEITLLDPACGTMHFGLVAFDLFARMYEEELEHAGQPGWPSQPSVRDASEIPAAIIDHNLFGIDIDLRAVQLSALTLYLKAASLNSRVTIRHSNLACADILLLNGNRLNAFIEASHFSRPIYERLIRKLWEKLSGANELGSLIRLEDEIRRIVAEERARFRLEGQGRLPFPELRGLFEEEAEEDAYWDILEAQIVQAFDEFAKQQARAGADQTYFAGEATKGMRLLDVMLRRYDIVAANPPYMTSRNMSPAMSAFLKQDYPASKGDLYAAFIDRCADLLAPGGRLAMITQQSFMFISSYEDLRAKLRKLVAIETMIHVGPRAFAEIGGEKVNTTLFVLRAEPDTMRRDASTGTYIRLVREPDAEAKRRGFERAAAHLQAGESDPVVYRYRQGDFDAIPGSPWVYWITPGLRHLFQTLPKLGDIAQPRQGLATADNFRFLRYWWEIGAPRIGFGCASGIEARASRKRWFPYMKGGEFQRWWGNQEYTVNWANDGHEIKDYICEAYPYLKGKWQWVAKNTEYYFRRGVTYTAISSKAFSARYLPGTMPFDHAGNCIFMASEPELIEVVALLNSELIAHFLGLLNPTVNYYTNDLERLPIPTHSSDTLNVLVARAIALARADSAEDETTYEFVAPPAWPDGIERVAARHAELAAVEREIDEEVYRLYGISAEDRAAIEAELDLTPGLSPSGEGSMDGADGAAEEMTSGDEDGDTVAATRGQRAGAESTNGANGQGRAALAQRWVSYAVGIALGRFQPGVEGALGNGVSALPAPGETPAPEMVAVAPLAPDVAGDIAALVVPNGIAVLDSGHPDDLAGRVTRALELLVGESEAEALIAAATGGKPLAEWLARDFFKEHVKRYRKRPIYWLLQSPKRRYGVYLFSERVTRDTLHLLRGNHYVAGRAALLRKDATPLRERAQHLPQGAERRRAERELEALEADLADLEAFDKALAAITTQTNSRGEIAGWAPELDDGILINLAPLYPLLPAWSAEPKACWAELERGTYDWSHTAMRYWPDRVLAACRENKSYAIAHGVEARV